MREFRQKNGLERIRTNKIYRPRIFFETPKNFPNEEDTLIRREIYKTINDMMNFNKSDIEIEIFLVQKYPDYAEYIPKVISDQFAKRKRMQTKAQKSEIGDEEK